MKNQNNLQSVKNFIQHWSGHGYEKGETHSFWLAFLRDVFNISEPEKFINFEVPVKLKHKSFIDAFLPDTKVIIEQKSSSVKLEKNQTQSDGEILSPYEQAQRYGNSLPVSMHPRFIIVCNFKEFLIYDMELMSEPTKILLEELPENFHAFDFMIDPNKNKNRIELFFFPSYSPQLNPDEYLNNILKKNVHSGDLPHTELQLERKTKNFMNAISHQPDKISNLFLHEKLVFMKHAFAS